MREKPNCSLIAIESIILFKNNKTAEWLQTKSEDEKKALFKACIRLGRKEREVWKQRKDEIEIHREKVIIENERIIAEKQDAQKKS